MKKRKILIIDDEVAFTNIVKLNLESDAAYEVCMENNPCAARATARKFRPAIIILDVVMPDMDGGELHTQFMADPALDNVPIVFLTAIVRQKQVDDRNRMIGGCIFLAKPVSSDGLTSAIDERLHS